MEQEPQTREAASGVVLYDGGDHKFIYLGAEQAHKSGVIQTMQYLIVDHDRGILLDPGGVHLFAHVAAAISRFISMDKIDAVFFSHQDPDVSSGISLWMGLTNAKIYISDLWVRFLPHFGIMDASRIHGVADAGGRIQLGTSQLECVPSHFMHSPGMFSLYDRAAGILFSSDIGAAVFEKEEAPVFVDDFSAHIKYMEGFHRRYIASNAAARRWAAEARKLNPAMIAPQHGSIYRGAAVEGFITWMENLRCGVDLLDQIYGRGV